MGIKGRSFRQKIYLSFLLLFLAFVLLLIALSPFVGKWIEEANFHREVKSLIVKVKKATSEEEMVSLIQRETALPFFGVTLLDPRVGILYESPTPAPKEAFADEMESAIRKGKGFEKRYSEAYQKMMVFYALSFDFQGKQYVMRVGFPLEETHLFRSTFVFATFSITAIVLLLFGLLAGFIVQVLTKPIKQIIHAIKSYRAGKGEFIPEIPLSPTVAPRDDFGQLSETLNALSKKIETQISTLTKEKNSNSAILEALGEGVVAVDHQMTVIYINQMAERFLDLKKEEILGKSFVLAKQEKCHQLIHESQTRHEPVLAVLQLEKRPKRFLDALAVPRGKEGAILILQDRTSLHKVIELGRDFIANASHELKTPITIIRGFAETLHDHPELSHDTYKEITAKIVSNCERMEKLVRNLLTLAAIDEGMPISRLQECDVSDLLGTAQQTILAIHPHAQIEIEVKGDPYLLMDPDLLLQAVLNLLDNAVKYSKGPARVKITVEQQDKEVFIRIADKGVGIPAEDLDKIFERFYAVDKTFSRSMGGSGLGLSIVARIIEKHKGKIYVESELGKGSVFTMVFPVPDDLL